MDEDMIRKLNEEVETYKRAVEAAEEALDEVMDEMENWFEDNDLEDNADWIIIF